MSNCQTPFLSPALLVAIGSYGVLEREVVISEISGVASFFHLPQAGAESFIPRMECVPLMGDVSKFGYALNWGGVQSTTLLLYSLRILVPKILW